eukprot:1716882-Amphidinium_carterae.2
MEAYIAGLKQARLEWLAEDTASSIIVDKAYAAKLLSGSGPTARDRKRRSTTVPLSQKLLVWRVMCCSVADLELARPSAHQTTY